MGETITFADVVVHLARLGVKTPFPVDFGTPIGEVCLLGEGTHGADTGVLRVGRLSAYGSLAPSERTGSFVLTRDVPLSQLGTPSSGNLAFVDKGCDLVDLAADLRGLLGRSGDLEDVRDRMLEVLLHGDDMAALIGLVSEALGNPVLVCDSSCNILAHGGEGSADDAMWATGIVRGQLPFELTARLRGDDSGWFESDPTRTTLVMAGVSSHRYLVRKLMYSGAFMGYLVVLESHHPLEGPGDEPYRFSGEVLAKQLGAAGTRTGPAAGHRSREINLLIDLLTGRIESASMVQELMGDTAFAADLSYRVLAIDMRMRAQPDADAQDLVGRWVEEALPAAHVIFLQNWVAVLVSRPGIAMIREDEGMFDAVRDLLDDHGLRAGISDGFMDLAELPWHFDQATVALRLAQEAGEDDGLALYSDHRMAHLLESVPRDRRQRYAAPAVAAMARDEGSHGSGLRATFETYLHCAGSVAETARRLQLHRNTVTYRLNQIHERYGIDPWDRERLVDNLLSCLIVDEGGAGP